MLSKVLLGKCLQEHQLRPIYSPDDGFVTRQGSSSCCQYWLLPLDETTQRGQPARHSVYVSRRQSVIHMRHEVLRLVSERSLREDANFQWFLTQNIAIILDHCDASCNILNITKILNIAWFYFESLGREKLKTMNTVCQKILRSPQIYIIVWYLPAPIFIYWHIFIVYTTLAIQ